MSATIQSNRFRSGQLREKFSVQRGCRHGVARTWHRNGILASEQFFKDGILNGHCRQWNEFGKLLGQFDMQLGTGVQREWHENGQLKIEVTTIRGTFSGRNRIWLRDGTLMAERFYIDGTNVTPSRYAKAAASDRSRPSYSEEPASLPKRSRSFERLIHDNFIAGVLAQDNGKEAKAWFNDGEAAKRERSLGRFRSARAAHAFVESLYASGAIEVTAPAVYQDRRGNEFADGLLVRLPKAKAARGKVRKACGALVIRSKGAILPERDLGESHLYLSME